MPPKRQIFVDRFLFFQKKLENLGGIFDVEKKQKRLEELELKSQNPALWSNVSEMQKINREKTMLQRDLEQWTKLHSLILDAQTLLELVLEEKDEPAFETLKSDLASYQIELEELELKKMLSGEMDSNSAFFSINSGAGGTEACDWAQILMRMYLRYAERKGYTAEIMEMTEGEGAGIKSVTLHIQGPYAYGYLKAESGVHRLVRISPFDSNARRHTSFASAFAWPEIDDDIEIEVRSEDLRVDTYRAGGAGGQHVNKTDSAVRITHIPSGIVVQCQNERSQHANRDKAMKMLKAALYEREMEARQKERDQMNATKKANEWGSQIRSYVLHPYQMAKDHRTTHETSQVADVLDGNLDAFIVAFLKASSSSTSSQGPTEGV